MISIKTPGRLGKTLERSVDSRIKTGLLQSLERSSDDLNLMPLRSRGYLMVLVLVAALAIAQQETAAADLERTTVAAYDRFLETVAQAFSKQVGTDAFLVQASPQALDRLRHGEILLEPGSGDGIIEVPNGLIHHWRATAFVPDVTLEEVLRVARDYTKYASIYRLGRRCRSRSNARAATVSVRFFAHEGVRVQ